MRPLLEMKRLYVLAALLAVILLSAGVALADRGDRLSSWDFPAAGNSAPRGMWSDGTTLWVIKQNDRQVYAYVVATKARDTSKEFTLATANSNPYGMWGNSSHLFVSDINGSVYKYDRSDLSAAPTTLITGLPNVGGTRGIWSDGTTLWVSNQNTDMAYGVVLATGARDTSKDYSTMSAAGNGNIRGMDGVDGYMLIADNADDQVYVYEADDGDNVSSMTIDLDSGNSNASGVYVLRGAEPGGVLLVGDQSGGTIYGYEWAGGLSAPTPGVGSITQSGASVSWTAVANATSYDMRLKKQADSTWTTTTGVTSPRSVTGLDTNTAYEVQLRSQASGYAYGAWSSSVNFTTAEHAALSAPTPSVGSITASGASVSWTAVANATSYDMRLKKQSDNTWTTTTGVTSPRSVTGLDANTAYEVQLRSQASGYAHGAWSSSGNFTTAKNAALSAPTPSVGSITASGASVSWTAVTDAESYDGRYKKQSDSAWTMATGVTSAWSLSGLDRTTDYEVQLRSMADDYEDGAWSASANFTTLARAPGAPTSLTATGGANSISLSWTAPADDGGSAVTGYQYQQDGGNWQSAGTGTAYTVTGLNNSATHIYKVRAVNSEGAGPPSGVAIGTTAGPTPTPLPPPTPTSPKPTPTPTPRGAPGGLLGTVIINVGNGGGTEYGYKVNGYGGIQGEAPGILYADGDGNLARTGVLELTVAADASMRLELNGPKAAAAQTRLLMVRIMAPGGEELARYYLYRGSACVSGPNTANSYCLAAEGAAQTESPLLAWNGKQLAVQIFALDVLARDIANGGVSSVVVAPASFTAGGWQSYGYLAGPQLKAALDYSPASGGALVAASALPDGWFSVPNDFAPVINAAILNYDGDRLVSILLAYGTSSADDNRWRYSRAAFEDYAVRVVDAAGRVFAEANLGEALEETGAAGSGVYDVNCGLPLTGQRTGWSLCLDMRDFDQPDRAAPEGLLLFRVSDDRYKQMLLKTPGGAIAAQLFAGAFAAVLVGLRTWRMRSPGREIYILLALAIGAAIPPFFDVGTLFWPMGLMVLAGVFWVATHFTRSRR